MQGGVFLLTGGDLVALRERPYDSEDLLQALLEHHPELLAGDQVGDEARRWLLVRREAGVPGHEGGGGRWSLDHVFIDNEAIPTLVEVKRSADTRIRREVVGQMLDYAANGIVYWPADRLRAEFEARCERDGLDPEAAFADALGDDREPDEFWLGVERNLRACRVRLVFCSDEVPPELRRVIEFLNEQMSPAEVIGLEVRQYVGDGELKTLVPRVVGQTEQARAQKGAPSASIPIDWDFYEETLPPAHYAIARSLYDRLEAAIAKHGDLQWTSALRRGYLGFKRAGDYFTVGIDFFRDKPVELWVKLPLNLDELRGRGLDADDPFPQLASRWRPGKRQLHWAVPSTNDVPDVEAAVDLTARYQPDSGPMREPAPVR